MSELADRLLKQRESFTPPRLSARQQTQSVLTNLHASTNKLIAASSSLTATAGKILTDLKKADEEYKKAYEDTQKREERENSIREEQCKRLLDMLSKPIILPSPSISTFSNPFLLTRPVTRYTNSGTHSNNATPSATNGVAAATPTTTETPSRSASASAPT